MRQRLIGKGYHWWEVTDKNITCCSPHHKKGLQRSLQNAGHTLDKILVWNNCDKGHLLWVLSRLGICFEKGKPIQSTLAQRTLQADDWLELPVVTREERADMDREGRHRQIEQAQTKLIYTGNIFHIVFISSRLMLVNLGAIISWTQVAL